MFSNNIERFFFKVLVYFIDKLILFEDRLFPLRTFRFSTRFFFFQIYCFRDFEFVTLFFEIRESFEVQITLDILFNNRFLSIIFRTFGFFSGLFGNIRSIKNIVEFIACERFIFGQFSFRSGFFIRSFFRYLF